VIRNGEDFLEERGKSKVGEMIDGIRTCEGSRWWGTTYQNKMGLG